MDPAILSAIIVAVATLSAAVLGSWLQHRRQLPASRKGGNSFEPDEDDIYFLTYLLHDGYEQDRPMSTTELAQHHDRYAPLELEVKLIRLERNGFVSRANKKNSSIGDWRILPHGIEYMMADGHQLHDLVEEDRRSA
ncbi:hypothetical protein [Aquisalimonas lutea]|uniref:hypothetical protein n=1 Tax=Aquisalimonas lutea TaxID=1327750 RepID=UPI0025B31CD9|nr:hypothetical protein [Aquisalimonas lutea]